MIRLLIILWPALLPLLVYASWCVWRYKRKQAGHEVPPIKAKLFITVIATIVIAALCLVVLGSQQKRNDGKGYQPVQYKDGKLVPGTMGR